MSSRVIRLFFFVLALAGGLWLCAGVSPANSPAAAQSIVISPDHVPEEAEYIELLIPMPQNDPYYRSFNKTAAEETGLTYQASIAGYRDEDGYISYSFHMEQAVSRMKLEENSQEEGHYDSYGFGDGAYAGSETHLEYIQKNFGTIKAALLDGEGNILAVSHEASIRSGSSGYLAGTIAYDCADGRLSPSIYKGNAVGPILIAAILLLCMLVSLIGRAVFTSTVESGVALIFRIRPWPTVFLVNFVSNIIFNLLLTLSVTMLRIPYLVFVTAGEIIVVCGEYTMYRRLLASPVKPRILTFAITANLTSLLLGLGLNYVLSGLGFYRLAQML